MSEVKESQAEAAGWMVIPFSESKETGREEKKGDEERTVQRVGMASQILFVVLSFVLLRYKIRWAKYMSLWYEFSLGAL